MINFHKRPMVIKIRQYGNSITYRATRDYSVNLEYKLCMS